ncbi:MAG: DUF3105 domain-containing protein [Alphaproteobacteria bacterium]
MARSRRKPRRKAARRPAAATRRQGRRRLGITAALAVLVIGVSAWYWNAERDREAAFLEHARRGAGAIESLARRADEGRSHLAPGESVRYVSDPPTSGAHDPEPIDPGVYRNVQARDKLVHSLEHGMIVVYYDKPEQSAWETLDAWAALYDAPWSGIVLAPRPGLGEALILTAWRRMLRQKTFDPDAAAAFIDAYRGRGPENPVR